ncbi:hypothetical protein OPT61_g7541 [Boeremia exigua]|uniref:Uncharacterized protein n=1 Tax=Boeremia exigua TaxID=749465 RepID=A0ACC2I2V5_9PLEO|nr:hypothetical protein OPT61_g7541 [Boeremia exigua]
MADPSKLTGDPNSHDLSKFSESLSATCLCKSIRVTINDNELFTRPRGHLCHCANCRKVAGSYVSSNLAIEKEKVVVDDPKGVIKKYEDRETGSGKKSYHVDRRDFSYDGDSQDGHVSSYSAAGVRELCAAQAPLAGQARRVDAV